VTIAFTGRVVLITGASRGLGRATAELFLKEGARVAVNVRTRERAETLASQLGEGARAVPGDIRKPEIVQRIVDQTIDRLGRLDILVNNAAVAPSTRFEQISDDEWQDVVDVNMTAAFRFIKAVVPQMKKQQFGRIINISSLAGRSVSTLAGAHYSATKAGLQGLTRGAAKELGRYGITVNAICPGLFDTELAHSNATPERLQAIQAGFPVPRLGRPEELARFVAFLASDAAGYITGASLDINGGALMM
jgi:3-oxoacyl-[acyl-carrier protein] reductase